MKLGQHSLQNTSVPSKVLVQSCCHGASVSRSVIIHLCNVIVNNKILY